MFCDRCLISIDSYRCSTISYKNGFIRVYNRGWIDCENKKRCLILAKAVMLWLQYRWSNIMLRRPIYCFRHLMNNGRRTIYKRTTDFLIVTLSGIKQLTTRKGVGRRWVWFCVLKIWYKHIFLRLIFDLELKRITLCNNLSFSGCNNRFLSKERLK